MGTVQGPRTTNAAAEALEITVYDLLLSGAHDHARRAASSAYDLIRESPLPDEPMDAGRQLLRAALMAHIARRTAECGRWLQEVTAAGQWPVLPVSAPDWGLRCRATAFDAWLRIYRDAPGDEDAISKAAEGIRADQGHEVAYLMGDDGITSRSQSRALELIALYHIISAAEDAVDGDDPSTNLQYAVRAASRASAIDLEMLARWLLLAL